MPPSAGLLLVSCSARLRSSAVTSPCRHDLAHIESIVPCEAERASAAAREARETVPRTVTRAQIDTNVSVAILSSLDKVVRHVEYMCPPDNSESSRNRPVQYEPGARPAPSDMLGLCHHGLNPSSICMIG